MHSKIKSFGIEGNRLLTMSWVQSFSRVLEKKVQLWQTADQISDDLMSAELVFQVCVWFLQALVSSVTGQAGTAESCHLLPPSNPSPPIICSSPPSLLLAGAVRSNDRQSSEQELLSSRVLRPGAGQEAHALSSAGLTHREGRQARTLREEWVDGWTDRRTSYLSLPTLQHQFVP